MIVAQTNYALALAKDTAIDAKQNWYSQAAIMGDATPNARFKCCANKYPGIRFKKDDSAFYYGWIKIAHLSATLDTLGVRGTCYHARVGGEILAGTGER